MELAEDLHERLAQLSRPAGDLLAPSLHTKSE